jgi:predicted DNA-binding transcriptional regulator AlpA
MSYNFATQSQPLVITAGQVAHLLNISEPTFRQRLKALATVDFPPKLPGLNGWSLPAVTRWIETSGRTSEPPEALMALDAISLEIETAYSGSGQ